MMTRCVTLHRVLKVPPHKVHRAFTQAAAIATWLPPYGFVCTVHHLDARVGGGYKMYARFSDDPSFPIAFQFLPLATYWRERSDHPFYGQRQLLGLESLRASGAPVDALMGAVERESARAAQDWRDAHASQA